MPVSPVAVVICQFGIDADLSTVAEALAPAVTSGTIGVVDLVLISKDADGTVTVSDLEDRLPEIWAQISPDPRTLLSQDDIDAVAGGLEPSSKAAVLVAEHRWAATLADAAAKAGGALTALTPIADEDLVAALAASDAEN